MEYIIKKKNGHILIIFFFFFCNVLKCFENSVTMQKIVMVLKAFVDFWVKYDLDRISTHLFNSYSIVRLFLGPLYVLGFREHLAGGWFYHCSQLHYSLLKIPWLTGTSVSHFITPPPRIPSPALVPL